MNRSPMVHSAFVFPRQRRGWRRKKSGWFLLSQNAGGVESGVEWSGVEWRRREEKRRECDVWPRVKWSGVEEKRRKEFFWFPKTLPHCICTCFLCIISNAFGPRADPFWPAGWPDGLSGWTGRAVSGWRAEFSDPAHAFLVGLAGRPVGPGPF